MQYLKPAIRARLLSVPQMATFTVPNHDSMLLERASNSLIVVTAGQKFHILP